MDTQGKQARGVVRVGWETRPPGSNEAPAPAWAPLDSGGMEAMHP